MQSELRPFDNDIKPGANRTFGFVFATFFGIIYGWQAWYGTARHWLLTCALVFIFLAMVRPAALHPLNTLWFKFGLRLHAFTTPLILAVIFFLVITPIGILMRLIGKRTLHLSNDPNASSYWINRKPPGPATESFRNQF